MRSTRDLMLGWVLPITCVALASGAIFMQYRRHQETQTKLEQTLQQVTTTQVRKAELEANLGKNQFASIRAGELEESAFLGEMRRRATESNVIITRWGSRGGGPVSPPPEDGSAPPPGPVLARRQGELALAGSYDNLRRFLADLQRAQRLYTIGDVRWARRPEGGNEVIFLITRYVEEGSAS